MTLRIGRKEINLGIAGIGAVRERLIACVVKLEVRL
jgi:hypothetical protein